MNPIRSFSGNLNIVVIAHNTCNYNINDGESYQFQLFYQNQRALSSTKSKETAAKTAEIARSSSRGERRYENHIVTSNNSSHNFSPMEVETCYHSF